MSCPEQTLADLTLPAKVGQLIMLGFDSGGSSAGAIRAVRRHHLGEVTMTGRNYSGVEAVRTTTDRLQAAASLPLFVATDQEGGQVQVLHGPGFPEMPSAKEQGRLPTGVLEQRAQRWGTALKKAGINLDLAPVLAVVPKSLGVENLPLGQYDRQYGSLASRVTTHGLAFGAGLEGSGVVPVVKHFPGLGSVRANTDDTAHVTDTTTGPNSDAIKPFAAAVRAGLPVIMISSATYTRIDATNPAMFSAPVITGLLREKLGFDGVVLSDDMGAAASAVAFGTAARRAIAFISAGGDVILTVNPADVPIMIRALVRRAKDEPAFAELVDASVLRVLVAKKAAAVLHCTKG